MRSMCGDLGMRVADGIEPRESFETHRIHHQCVPPFQTDSQTRGCPETSELGRLSAISAARNLCIQGLINVVWGLHNV